MSYRSRQTLRKCGVLRPLLLAVSVWVLGQVPLVSQTTATGGLTGEVVDLSGAVIPEAALRLTSEETNTVFSATSDDLGRFSFLLLAPGNYQLDVSKTDFRALTLPGLVISVTETLRVDPRLRLATQLQSTDVQSQPTLMIQTDTSALGRVVNEATLSELPMVTRNFTQIAGLSPGVIVGVYNAGELGLGGTALSQIAASNDGIFVHGARSYDNNFILDGISVSDVQGSASGSGGIPLPNPDSLQEFKVQTGLYDAGYGRYAGANVSVITKSGGNAFHGTVFEFFRNEALNASDYFLNRAPVLKENQFGFAFGGPIKKEKLLFFSSYQGTRQSNGAASGQSRVACSAGLNEPPLTDDRSPPALGRLFGGMAGALGGEAVKADGSNVNPVALNLLNFKLSDGSFLIPTPQTVDPTMPFAQQGLSFLSRPCRFSEDQFLANVDYLTTSNSRFTVRYLFAPGSETVTFPGNGVDPAGNVPGFPSPSESDFQVLSIARIDGFHNGWQNEAQFGYVRTKTSTQAEAPFKWSDVGVAEGEMNDNNELPSLRILGSISLASGFPRTMTQNSFVFSDGLSFIHGAHTGRLGGSVTRVQDNVDLVGLASFADFLSWPDFLLGLSAQGNGSAFSNVYSSIDAFGLTTREYRAWEGVAFAQDNYRVNSSLALNLGVRYERLGEFGDNLGRNASFDFSKADPSPPPNGSLAGYLVASNFSGALPQGVTRVDNTYGNYGVGQDTIAPRIGFSQQLLPHLIPLVLRGGYGIYYSRPTGQAFYQNIFGAPFSEFRISSGPSNANATFQSPFLQPFPTPESFPEFSSYSPASTATVYAVSPDFRPAIIHQYSLNVQVEPRNAWLLEVGYVGTRGLHLVRQRSFNQAQSASVSSPVRGVTTNTIANIPSRLPILGIPSDSGIEMESEGSSWYNGLEVSLTKLLGRGFQFLASYTFSKTLDTDGADINSTSSGNQVTLGDQNSPNQRWGRASFDRTHRFVISGTWALPSAGNEIQRAIFGGWTLASIVTVQSGNALTIAYTNPQNVFGISEDRAELTGRCKNSQFVTGGPINSKLGNYFDNSCFTTPPVIGTDGTGTAFGNSRTGAATGPGQANVDVAFSKILKCRRPVEGGGLEFRTEFYNALNHPQFANPDNDFASPTFGAIRSTSVSSRVIQLALKFAF
jgi:hypothetical protein